MWTLVQVQVLPPPPPPPPPPSPPRCMIDASAVSDDEAELKATNLAEHFYKHLASLKEEVQIIVIENADPPTAIRDLARIETFTGL